jgi:hypothetical protein
MEKKIQHKESRGLPGGPNEMFTYTTGIFSTEGFRMDSPDVNNYENIIPSGSITMKEKDGSPLRKGPIYGVDNLGNEQLMYPGYDYEFPGTQVKETLLAKMGGGLLDKTIKCSSCGWEWKAADGGSDIMDCHKCGGEGMVKAQKGGRVSIPVTDRNDPRLKNYSDSLSVFNTGTNLKNKLMNFHNSLPNGLEKEKEVFGDDNYEKGVKYNIALVEGKDNKDKYRKLRGDYVKYINEHFGTRTSPMIDYTRQVGTYSPNAGGSSEWVYNFKKPEQPYYLERSNMDTIPSRGISNIDANDNLSLKPMSVDSNQYVPDNKVYVMRNPNGTESIIDNVEAHSMIKRGVPGIYSRKVDNIKRENISNPYDESIAQNYQTGGSTGEEDLMTEYGKRIVKKVAQYGDKLRPASFSNKAADMAEAKGFGFGEDNQGPLDAVRHASAAASVASNLPVPSFMNNILSGSEQAIREYGSRALGALYEVANYNSEGRDMDFYNNKIGAQIGSIPGLTDEQRLKLINNALLNKQLQIDNNKRIKPKQEGGEQEDTPWTAYLNPANWGTSRYDDAGTFKKAFRAARIEGDSDFLYKGNRYSTELKPAAPPLKGITPELLIRQAYRESTFNPNAVSPAGFKGIGQIGKAVIKDYKKANNITGEIDPFNIKQNSDVQKYTMNELYNSSFIDKPGQSEEVRLAKTLASYNLGRTKVSDLLNDLKEEGVDIYNSLDWINKLPSESRKYINDILLQKNTTFNSDFSKALSDKKNIPIKRLYGFRDGGESKPGPLMKAYNRLPIEKKMGGAIVNKKQFGGQLNSGNITMYKDYIKGNVENETEAVKNYDKLNRIYYSKAKELGMSAANYIMTHVADNS